MRRRIESTYLLNHVGSGTTRYNAVKQEPPPACHVKKFHADSCLLSVLSGKLK